MTHSEEDKRPVHLGFLTALGDPSRGLVGGFLALNAAGRPTEFHCTAPVRPNRAQEILYGNTLEGFVCGEQIAPALVGRSKAKFAAILTNNPNMLTAKNLLKIPLGMVFRRASTTLNSEEKEKYAVWDENRDAVKSDAARRSARSTSVSSLPANGSPDATSTPPWEDPPTETTFEPNADESTNKSTNASNGTKLTNGEFTDGNANAASGGKKINGAEFADGKGARSFFFESFERTPTVPGVDFAEWRVVAKGKNRIAFPISFDRGDGRAATCEEIADRLDVFFKSIDSEEPFERIRLAIEEAQKSC